MHPTLCQNNEKALGLASRQHVQQHRYQHGDGRRWRQLTENPDVVQSTFESA